MNNTYNQNTNQKFVNRLCLVQIQRGLVELRVIDRTNLSQHRSLSGNVKLPWWSEELEGSVEVRLLDQLSTTAVLKGLVCPELFSQKNIYLNNNLNE